MSYIETKPSATSFRINKPDRAQFYAKLGVDGITTDDPVMVRAAIAKP